MGNDKWWRGFWVDAALKDEWLERLNSIPGVAIGYTDSGYGKNRPPSFTYQLTGAPSGRREMDRSHREAVRIFKGIAHIDSRTTLVGVDALVPADEMSPQEFEAWWEEAISRLETLATDARWNPGLFTLCKMTVVNPAHERHLSSYSTVIDHDTGKGSDFLVSVKDGVLEFAYGMNTAGQILNCMPTTMEEAQEFLRKIIPKGVGAQGVKTECVEGLTLDQAVESVLNEWDEFHPGPTAWGEEIPRDVADDTLRFVLFNCFRRAGGY